MNRRKLKRQHDHLKILISILKHWDFYVKDSYGFFTGKVKIITWGKELILNKKQLEDHINRTKTNIRKYLINDRADRATAAYLAHNQEGVLGSTPSSAKF